MLYIHLGVLRPFAVFFFNSLLEPALDNRNFCIGLKRSHDISNINDRIALAVFGDAFRNANAGGGINEVRRAYLNRACPYKKELNRIFPCRNAANPYDRNFHRLVCLIYLGKSNRLNIRT